jgi:SsrA-binding protein
MSIFPQVKVVARNRKAFHDYEILEQVEAGIELVGTEVKSVRAGQVSLADSYAQCADGQVYLVHLHIAPYKQGSSYNRDPYRKRRLLLHQREIGHLCGEVRLKRLALVPLQVYIKDRWVKVELGLARGRRMYDKRRKIADAENKRRLAHVLSESRRRQERV